MKEGFKITKQELWRLKKNGNVKYIPKFNPSSEETEFEEDQNLVDPTKVGEKRDLYARFPDREINLCACEDNFCFPCRHLKDGNIT